MRNQGFASSFAFLVLSSCVLEGYSLPQARYSVDDYARKFGSAPIDANMSNDIEEKTSAVSAESKEEGSLLTTVMKMALEYVPLLINMLSGSTGPSQTDRIESIDLNGEDPFSVKNLATLGLKLFLAIAGGSTGNSKSGSIEGPLEGMQPLVKVVIGAITGSGDQQEVEVMAKQATEVINLVVTLVNAITTSMSERSFSY